MLATFSETNDQAYCPASIKFLNGVCVLNGFVCTNKGFVFDPVMNTRILDCATPKSAALSTLIASLYPKASMQLFHWGYNVQVINSVTFSTMKAFGSVASTQATTAHAVLRAESWCGLSTPLALLCPWQEGLARSTSYSGSVVKSACCKSWQLWCVAGWLHSCT